LAFWCSGEPSLAHRKLKENSLPLLNTATPGCHATTTHRQRFMVTLEGSPKARACGTVRSR